MPPVTDCIEIITHSDSVNVLRSPAIRITKGLDIVVTCSRFPSVFIVCADFMGSVCCYMFVARVRFVLLKLFPSFVKYASMYKIIGISPRK